MLRQALEKTSDRLEGFLQKLQAVQPDKNGKPVDAVLPKGNGETPAGEKGPTAASDASWLQPGYPQKGSRARAEPRDLPQLNAAGGGH